MSTPSLFPLIFNYLLRSSPLLVVLIAGGVIALLRWRRHPKASLLLALGAGVMLVGSFASFVAYAWVNMSGASGPVVAGMPMVYSIISLVSGLIHAAGLALMIWGGLAGRDPVVSAGFPPVMHAPAVTSPVARPDRSA